MKQLVVVISLIPLIFLNSCHTKTPAELNSINFRDSPENVYDSIVKLNSLLNRLPYSANVVLRNYKFATENNHMMSNYFTDSVLYINNNKIDFQTIDTVQVLEAYSFQERRIMISLIKYLKENFVLNAGYGSFFGPFWYYGYREDLSQQYRPDIRCLVALKELEDTSYFKLASFSRIIDRKGKLILVGE